MVSLKLFIRFKRYD